MSDFFDWDEANIAHIAEHNVTPAEAEQVVSNNPLDLDYAVVFGEARIRQVGETSRGRILAVITTERGELTRVVTAYDASRFLKLAYLKYKESFQDGKENPY
jgi:uncharacterized DUF497 family protein